MRPPTTENLLELEPDKNKLFHKLKDATVDLKAGNYFFCYIEKGGEDWIITPERLRDLIKRLEKEE